jgi:hypothetical protein
MQFRIDPGLSGLFLRPGDVSEASLEKAKQPPSSGICGILKLSVAGAGVFLVLAPACAALRFGLLLSAVSALSRLTHTQWHHWHTLTLPVSSFKF